MRDLASRSVRLVEVQTPSASPFARSLLFGYLGVFVYEGDAPLAERRAQALSLDSALLAELLGATDLRELLDPEAIEQVEQEVTRLAPERHARGPDSVHDLLRSVGDLTTTEALARGATPQDLAALEDTRRAIRVRIAGEQRWLAIEDSGRVRDALGAALPVGVPEAFTEPVRDPLGDLLSRFARTHGPFVATDAAARLGLGVAVVSAGLARLAATGRVIQGEFRPGGMATEWCDAEVLRAIRRRSLAALRKEVEPVPPEALARFIPAWQGVGAGSTSRGAEGLLRAIEQLAGVAVPASMLETLVLPSRVVDYSPALLDELTLAGEVVWSGAGSLAGKDGWIALAPGEIAAQLLPDIEPVDDPVALAVRDALQADEAVFFRSLVDRVNAVREEGASPASEETVARAVWDLVWAGALTNDTLAPVRALLAANTRSGPTRPARQRRGRYARYARPRGAALTGGSGGTGVGVSRATLGMTGRWSAVPAREADPTRRALVTAEVLLDRYGLVTRASVGAERITGGFATVYPVLKAAEESGRARRGYFVEGLGASQFALPGAVDRLRAMARPADMSDTSADDRAVDRAADMISRIGSRPVDGVALVLAATDPANPYGAALPWPEAPRPTDDDGSPSARRGHQPARKAGALVVLIDGRCALYVERGGRTLLSFTDDSAVLQPAADALALAVRDGALGRLQVERADGVPVSASALGDALEAAGFRPTPRGLRLRG
jgi:ATP-dependent Lhr-like helicase